MYENAANPGIKADFAQSLRIGNAGRSRPYNLSTTVIVTFANQTSLLLFQWPRNKRNSFFQRSQLMITWKWFRHPFKPTTRCAGYIV